MPMPSAVSARAELPLAQLLSELREAAGARARPVALLGRGIEHDLAAERVDDQLVVLAHALGNTCDADDGRDLQRARQDRGVARRRAEPGDERGHRRLEQLRGVGRLQIVDHQHAALEIGRQGRDASRELRDDAPADVLHVHRAIAKIVDRRLREVRADLADRTLDRPLGVEQVADDRLLGHVLEQLVVVHHHVRVEDQSVVRRRLLADPRADLLELAPRALDRQLQPLDLELHVVRRDAVMADVGSVRADHDGPADAYARRGRDTAKRDPLAGHGSAALSETISD